MVKYSTLKLKYAAFLLLFHAATIPNMSRMLCHFWNTFQFQPSFPATVKMGKMAISVSSFLMSISKSLHLKKQHHFILWHSVTCYDKSPLSLIFFSKNIPGYNMGTPLLRDVHLSFPASPSGRESLPGRCLQARPQDIQAVLGAAWPAAFWVHPSDIWPNLKAAASLGIHTIKVMVTVFWTLVLQALV